MTEKSAMVDQVLELVEAHYMPRVFEDKERIKEQKKEAEALEKEKEKSKLEDPDNLGVINPTATPEEKKNFEELKN